MPNALQCMFPGHGRCALWFPIKPTLQTKTFAAQKKEGKEHTHTHTQPHTHTTTHTHTTPHTHTHAPKKKKRKKELYPNRVPEQGAAVIKAWAASWHRAKDWTPSGGSPAALEKPEKSGKKEKSSPFGVLLGSLRTAGCFSHSALFLCIADFHVECVWRGVAWRCARARACLRAGVHAMRACACAHWLTHTTCARLCAHMSYLFLP